MRRCILLMLVAAWQLIGWAATSQAAAPLTQEQKTWLARAERHDKSGWVYLHIEGQPQERGFQHGYLLAKETSEAILIARREWEHDTAMDWSWLVAKAKAMFAGKIDEENLAEMGGIAEGMSAARVPTTRDEIVAYNGAGELGFYWWPTVKDKIDGKTESDRQACSALIATGSMTADGGIVLGHNTMFPYVESFWRLILDVQPAKGHRILMQSAPGMIQSGTDFFITDAGLVGAETTISGFKGFDEKGIPEFVRMRRATQDAAGIDQWCAIMKAGNNGGYANSWLLGDINTGEIARLELGWKHVGFEKKKDGYFVGSNVVEDPKILRFETSVNEADIRLSAVARRERWKQLMGQHKGKIDVELAKALLADHYDVYLQKDVPDNRTLCSHSDLDREPFGSKVPFSPWGTLDGKVVDTKMARQMSFAARWGSACGMGFDAGKFLEAHPQYDWMQGILKSRPSQPWTVFSAGERK